MTLGGTWSIGTIGSLWGGVLVQPSAKISTVPKTRFILISIISWDYLAAGAGGKGLKDLETHRGLEERNVPVGEQEVTSAGVKAVELIYFATGISRPHVAPRVP